LSDLQKQPAPPLPERSDAPAMVAVWDLPLRIVHWALAASVLIAWFTANVYDAVHEIAGYTVLGLIVFRLVWGFAGTRHSRFRSFVRPLRIVLRYLWHLAHGQTGRYLGLNPAGAAMTIALLVLLAISTISGWMQITQRFFGVEWVEQVHTYSSNLVVILVVVHVLGVLLMCALQKENLVRAMITGKKCERGDEIDSRESG
jgi:cytochrome b